MASENNQSKGKGVSLPGQPTEEAMAEVGSEAGKSLIRGLTRLGNAAFGGWIAKREAKAEATRLAIETEAKIGAAAAIVDARRADEIAELDHQRALQRRAERFRIEMAREQRNLEEIEKFALEYTERSPNNGAAREIDEDWLFRFADYAQKVSDKDVQKLWGRALSSSAIDDTPALSAVALQTLGLFDKSVAESFGKFAAVVVRLGFVPYVPDGQIEPQQIDRATLMDLGLIKEILREDTVSLEDFAFKGHKRVGSLPGDLLAYLDLTVRGREIARSVFRSADELPLSTEIEQIYLQHMLQQEMRVRRKVIILPTLPEGAQPISILITIANNVTNELRSANWKTLPSVAAISERLRKLIEWADEKYAIEFTSSAD